MQKMKRVLIALLCVVSVLGLMTSCEGFNLDFGSGDNTGQLPGETPGGGNDSGDDTGEEVGIVLTRCWKLKFFCDELVDVDIYINFGKSGKFTIYQRTEELAYTVFNGTYTVDEENSLLTGKYDDGASWASSYHYTVDVDAETLTMESVERPSEVSVYEPSEVPASATVNTRSASVSDVKPL